MLITAITFFVLLTILVLIHELGHYGIARLIGVHVEEFGLGLPPKIWGKRVGKTEYTVNALPIGGFVRLAGEDSEEEKKGSLPRSQYFWARSKTERALILAAGVAMNFLLAVILTAFLLTGGVMEPSGTVHVVSAIPGSPAAQAGLTKDDRILAIEPAAGGTASMTPRTPAEMIAYINRHKGEELKVRYRRGSADGEVRVTPRTEVPKGQGALGVAISDLELVTYAPAEIPVKALTINLTRAWDMLSSLGSVLWNIVTLRPLFTKTELPEIAGPIGIARVTGEAVKFGWKAVIEFASILSLNLAVLNILPIPALDGGRLAFVFIEKILGKKVRPAFERSAHQAGMIVLLLLIGLVTVNDLLRLARGG